VGLFPVEGAEKFPCFVIVSFPDEFVNFVSQFFHALFAVVIEALADGMLEGFDACFRGTSFLKGMSVINKFPVRIVWCIWRVF